MLGLLRDCRRRLDGGRRFIAALAGWGIKHKAHLLHRCAFNTSALNLLLQLKTLVAGVLKEIHELLPCGLLQAGKLVALVAVQPFLATLELQFAHPSGTCIFGSGKRRLAGGLGVAAMGGIDRGDALGHRHGLLGKHISHGGVFARSGNAAGKGNHVIFHRLAGGVAVYAAALVHDDQFHEALGDFHGGRGVADQGVHLNLAGGQFERAFQRPILIQVIGDIGKQPAKRIGNAWAAALAQGDSRLGSVGGNLDKGSVAVLQLVIGNLAGELGLAKAGGKHHALHVGLGLRRVFYHRLDAVALDDVSRSGEDAGKRLCGLLAAHHDGEVGD